MFQLPTIGSRAQRPRLVANDLAPDRADLRIRSLLDDAGLRRTMGLDTAVTELRRPERRFDRRRLLEGTAA